MTSDKTTVAPVIVIAAYRRVAGLERLLSSIAEADFSIYIPPKVIISFDGGYDEGVVEVAERFRNDFNVCDVELVKRQNNIGLKEHILWCGDSSVIYDAVIVLEDDLYLDSNFYSYAVETLNFYCEENKVCGISLYSQEYNEIAQLPFKSLKDGSSTYFMQVPCSWGQIWTREHWQLFRQWLEKSCDLDLRTIISLPERAASWSDKSWKKWFYAYMVMTERYFVYPYSTYSTNFCDTGAQHALTATTVFQVSMCSPRRRFERFSFCSFNEGVRYDSYMEPDHNFLYEALGIERDDLCVDLYSTKAEREIIKHKYTLTSRSSKSPIKKFQLSVKPHDLSVLFPSPTGNITFSLSNDVCFKKRAIDFLYYIGFPITFRWILYRYIVISMFYKAKIKLFSFIRSS
jgi:hypothetical protein